MPEIPQSEIAATIFFGGRETGRKIGRNFGRNFEGVFVLCSLCRITQKTSPKIPRNLSLRVLRMKCQNFISVSFWGWRVPKYCTLPRDRLSDTPVSHVMGFWASRCGEIGCETLRVACKVEVRYPHARAVSS